MAAIFIVSVNVSILPSVLSGVSVQGAEQPHILMLPPPGFTAATVFLGWYAAPFKHVCITTSKEFSFGLIRLYPPSISQVCLNVVQHTLNSEHYLFSADSRSSCCSPQLLDYLSDNSSHSGSLRHTLLWNFHFQIMAQQCSQELSVVWKFFCNQCRRNVLQQ